MNYIHSVVQTSLLSVPRTFWSSQTETLYLFKNNTLFSPPSSSWQLLLSPLEKCLFKPFAQLDWIFCCSCSCCWVVRVLYVFWLLIPYQIHNLQIFFHSTGCLCSQCLWCTEVFLFLNSSLSIIFFSCLYFWCYIWKILTNPRSWSFSSVFSSKSFRVWTLIFNSLTIFCQYYCCFYWWVALWRSLVLTLQFPLCHLSGFPPPFFYWMDSIFFGWFENCTFNLVFLFLQTY